MANQPEITNMALFCDFENIALGVRDAKYAQFDIKKVLERLLLKGSIVVKKAYCDWDRYKEFKATCGCPPSSCRFASPAEFRSARKPLRAWWP